MESGTVDGVKLDTRIKRDSNKQDVINWWEGMSVQERKEILDKHESSFFKNRDAESNFESLQFDIQRDLIDEFNREML